VIAPIGVVIARIGIVIAPIGHRDHSGGQSAVRRQ
jgi:hypothetical protein